MTLRITRVYNLIFKYSLSFLNLILGGAFALATAPRMLLDRYHVLCLCTVSQNPADDTDSAFQTSSLQRVKVWEHADE